MKVTGRQCHVDDGVFTPFPSSSSSSPSFASSPSSKNAQQLSPSLHFLLSLITLLFSVFILIQSYPLIRSLYRHPNSNYPLIIHPFAPSLAPPLSPTSPPPSAGVLAPDGLARRRPVSAAAAMGSPHPGGEDVSPFRCQPTSAGMIDDFFFYFYFLTLFEWYR